MCVNDESSKESNGDSWINKRRDIKDETRDETMTEFRIVEIMARRFVNGREECQVQWAVTWEIVDKAFAEQQLYKEFIEDLEEDEKAIGNLKDPSCSKNRLITRQELALRQKKKLATVTLTRTRRRRQRRLLGRNALMEKQFDAVLVPKVCEKGRILTRA